MLNIFKNAVATPANQRFGNRVSLTRIGSAVLVLALLLGLVSLHWVPNVEMDDARRQLKRGWLLLTGRLVDVGGYRLYIECRGNGSPAVILDAGLNFGGGSWKEVQTELESLTRVCTYDRAGIRYSDRGIEPGTSKQVVRDLHTLLKNAKISAPYVLAGHSFGGLNMRLYACEYPQEVVGMVFIDSSHEDQYSRFAALMPELAARNYLRHEGGGNDERMDLLAGADQIRNAPPLPAIPLVVLTAGKTEWPIQASAAEARLAKMEMQDHLAQLIPNSKHIIVENCGHFIQWCNPSVVIASIKDVIRTARNPSPSQPSEK